MLEVCKLFEERIEKIMKELEESNYFNIVQFSQLQLALANPSCAEIQDLTYFEIVSLLHGFQLSLGDFCLKHDADDWPDELHVDIHGLREIVNFFRLSVWTRSESMYGILTFISFLPIFVVSYFRDDLFVIHMN
jgi:hypothetical protein